MSPIGPEGAGGAHRRKGTPRKNPANGKSPPSDGSKASRPAPFTKTTSGKTTSRSIAMPRISETGAGNKSTQSTATKPEARIPDLAWMKFCATCQATAMRDRTVQTASAIGKAPFTVAHGVRQMPSVFAGGTHAVAESTKTKVKELRERIITRAKDPEPRLKHKVPHKIYKPITGQAAEYPRGEKWLDKMDRIGENVDPLFVRADIVRGQVEHAGRTGTALDALYTAFLMCRESRAVHQVVGDAAMGRLARPKGVAEMWAISHRIGMNELRIAQITLQLAINELEARPQPLSAVDAKALQASFRLMVKLEDKALVAQKEFVYKGSLLGSDELFLLDLDGMDLNALNALAHELNIENSELQKLLPLQEAWVSVHTEEAKIHAQTEKLSYADSIITGLRLPNLLVEFWRNNITAASNVIDRILPAVHFFNYISLGLTAPLTIVSSGFSIYQWIAGERIVGKIDQYLTAREANHAEGKGPALDDELQAIADKIKTSQDRWQNLLNSIFSIMSTGTFFVNLGFVVIPTLIPSVIALATSIGVGIVFTGIAPWFVFVAGLVLLASTSGLLLYRIARNAQNQYRLRKCEFVVGQLDKILSKESQNIPEAERKTIEDELSQLLGYNLSDLSAEDKAALHHSFRIKLISISPEYAIDRFLHRLMDSMQSGSEKESNDAFEFLTSLNIFNEKELNAIEKSREQGTAHEEVNRLLRRGLRM